MVLGWISRKLEHFSFRHFVPVASGGDCSFGYSLGRPAMTLSPEAVGIVLQPADDAFEFLLSLLPGVRNQAAPLCALLDDLTVVRLILAEDARLRHAKRPAYSMADDGSVFPAGGFTSSVRCAVSQAAGGAPRRVGISMDCADWWGMEKTLHQSSHFVQRHLDEFDEERLPTEARTHALLSRKLADLRLHDLRDPRNQDAVAKSRR